MSAELTKAGITHAAIVDAGIALAQEAGLESLTIGRVADRAGLSKSGVFSRVGSREELQIAVLTEYSWATLGDDTCGNSYSRRPVVCA